MHFKIRIEPEEVLRISEEFRTLSENFSDLSRGFLNELTDMSGLWQGQDAEEYVKKAGLLTSQLSFLSDRFVVLSALIDTSVHNYESTVEDNISLIHSVLR